MQPNTSSSPNYDEWARMAADPDTTENDRETALAHLRPLIFQIEGEFASRFDGLLGEDFLSRVLSHMEKNITKFDPERVSQGGVCGWLRRIVRNLALDTIRSDRDALERSLSGQFFEPAGSFASASSARTRSEAALETLESNFQTIRQILNRIAWVPSSQIDYYCLALFQMRYRLTVCVIDGYGMQPKEGVDSPTCWVADRLPWSELERMRCFREGFPTLDSFWKQVRPVLHSGQWQVSAVLDVLNGSYSHTNPTTNRCWDKWMQRAREEVHKRVTGEEWLNFFQPWLAPFQRLTS